MGAQTQGCRSCKRKKVKCDNTRPKCNKCTKSGIECGGFGQQLRFVDENPRLRGSTAVSQAQSHEFQITRDYQTAFQSSRARRFSSPNSPLLPGTLPLTAFKADIFLSYLYAKLFSQERGNDTRCGLPKSWTLELVKTPQRPHYKSWDALAAIVFGRAHKNHGVITEALHVYGQALSELREKLSNSDDWHTDSILASMTALSIYEILRSESDQCWMFHVHGLGSLLELRGPWQKQPCSGTGISLEHRIILVAKSIACRQSTFLHHPLWKTAPWEYDPASKSAADFLLDIGADIAEYLAQIEHCSLRTIDHSPRYSQIRNSILTSFEQLNTWWQEWAPEHKQSAWEVAASHASTELLFPTLLEFETLDTAFIVSIYNAIRILLLQLWHEIQLLPQVPHSTAQPIILDIPNETVLLGISSDIRGLSSEILRSLTYAYGKCRRLVSTFSFLFVQDVAYGCFDKDSREAVWITEHAWAALAKLPDIEDSNLLQRRWPLGQIRIGKTSSASRETFGIEENVP